MSKARELSKLPNYVLSTVAELKLAVGKEQGDKAFIGGYYTDGDGGGGDFYWDAVSVEADNGGTIFQVTGTTTGRWKRIYSGSVNVKWFGAINVRWFGVREGLSNAITNCTSYATLALFINSIGGGVNILWDGDFYFSPKDNTSFNTAPNLWRAAVELVDVKHVYHIAHGAKIKVIADPTWYRGNGLNNCDEGVIQFRGSASNLCSNVGILGGYIYTDLVTADTTLSHLDGGAFGVAIRGCSNVKIETTVYGWGTDGIYVGTGYSNTPQSDNVLINNCISDSNFRQGLSVVGATNGTISNSIFCNTAGGSFGHGIDFEPDSGINSDWVVSNVITYNNQRGALNFISSQNINISNCNFNEVNTSVLNNGCIYIDGSQTFARITKNISFNNCSIIGAKATLYALGNYVDLISFTNCYLKTLGDVAVAQIRFNANTLENVGSLTINGCTIEGNGGISIKGTTGGLISCSFNFNNNKWYPSNEISTTASFLLDTNSVNVKANISDNTIDLTKNTFVITGTYTPVIPNCIFENNILESVSTFPITLNDFTGSNSLGTTIIGMNTFGTYFYYKGIVGGLDLKSRTAGAIVYGTGGDYGITRREVNGGLRRILQHISSPSSFTGSQAPLNGDITYNTGNNLDATPQIMYTYYGSKWRLTSFITYKSTTAARPTTTVYDVGLQYLDTTLDVDGKPIWWNGVAWVDATGAVV
jgi:hypothetical protein